MRKLAIVIGMALGLTFGAGTPALAQLGAPGPSVPGPGSGPDRGGEGAVSGDTLAAPVTRGNPGRVRASARREARPAPAPDPAAILATAQAHATAAGLTCQGTEAAHPGRIGEAEVYEIACAGSSGYIILASTPLQTFDCIELAGTAAIARAADPAADVGQQCMLPANQNGLQVIGQWARDAGAACTIDQAQAVGKNEGNMVYEVGCASADGYWLEKVAGTFTLTPCTKVTQQGGTCRFTTPAEIHTGFQQKLAGTEAAGCQVTQIRLMGSNANGEFYEAKCATDGEGYITRLNTQGAVQQVYPCATAQRIGGGCTLTTVAAPVTGGRP
jgi:hypothetical protein